MPGHRSELLESCRQPSSLKNEGEGECSRRKFSVRSLNDPRHISANVMQKKTKRQVNARRDKLRQSKQFKPAELPEAAVPKTDEDDRDFMPRLVIGHLSICVNGTLIDDIDSAT
jgi:hypothetical protein